MKPNVMLTNAMLLESAIPANGSVREKLLAVMVVAPEVCLTGTDEETLFRSSVLTVLVHYGKGSAEHTAIDHELGCLVLLHDGLASGDLKPALDKMLEGPPGVGLMALWGAAKKTHAARSN